MLKCPEKCDRQRSQKIMQPTNLEIIHSKCSFKNKADPKREETKKATQSKIDLMHFLFEAGIFSVNKGRQSDQRRYY